ncbi:uncharacterized protein BN553_01561 [Firmicutes bacterium CAG:238]|nr:uncharacterized protein BN553_01561 [Firmicutes bacterium CAG:238]
MKLRNMTELVKTIMEQQPETRSSDSLLYIEVLKRTTSQNVLNMPVWLFYQNLTEWQLPSIETVGRCRRKAQQENPHLKAKPEVEDFRYDRETEFIEFAVKG